MFANASLSLIEDRLGITVGGRYTRDEKDFSLAVSDTLTAANQASILAVIPGATFSLNPAASEFSASASETFAKFTPDVALEFNVTDDVLLYGKVSTGFKSGGFVGLGADLTQATLPFDEEEVINFEAGIKSSLANNRIIINANVFRMEFDDLQLRDRQLLIPGDESSAIVTIVNAASAVIKGIEADVTLYPIPNLTISGGLSVLDTEITEIAEGSTVELGTELPRAPDFATSWSANYTIPFDGFGDLTLGGGLQHTGGFFFDINEDTAGTEPSNTLFDARIAFEPEYGNWAIEVWGKNLTDEYYRTQVQSAVGEDLGVLTRVGDPRTWGMTFRLDF